MLKEYDRVLLKDGRQGTVVAGAPDGPFLIDIRTGLDSWDAEFVESEQIEKVISTDEK